MTYSSSKNISLERMPAEIIELKDRIQDCQTRCHSLNSALKRSEKSKEKMRLDYQEQLAEKDAVIKELENCPAHELALKGHDGTNTGIPTPQTPIGKKKAIPNSRRNTAGKKAGSRVISSLTTAPISTNAG